MFVIAGLGNPGASYGRTRHNVGFMLVDRLAGKHGIGFSASAMCQWGEGLVSGKEIVLLKPLTYMNRSGAAVEGFRAEFGAPVSSVLVVYDDCDLLFGKIRLRRSGGSGGHRGLESVIECLGTTDFPRLRLGVGRPSDGNIIDYVLSPFSREEEGPLLEMLDAGVGCVEAMLERDIDYAMNKCNAP